MVELNATASQLAEKIKNRKAKVAVVGMGYVGLPLAVEFAKAGLTVVGIDVVKERCDSINRGESHIGDIKSEEMAPLVKKGLLSASVPGPCLGEADAISICVPTPLGKSKDPDMTFIISAADEIAKYVRKGQLIVLESTTYPGTTEEVIRPRLEKNGLLVGRDLFLAFSPERVDPGNPVYHTRNTPKVVGGSSPQCSEMAATLYGLAVDNVVKVSNTQTAEMVKLLENTFRAVNIGLVNELAIICSKLNLSVWEVISAAATKPFGFMPFWPGPGLGGHCIPVDPHYLSWKMKSLNYHARFIGLADAVNGSMPDYSVELVVEALNHAKKPVNGSKILVLGVAYKPDVSDCRESPAMDVIKLLHRRGGDVSYCDPFVPEFDLEGTKMKATPFDAKVLAAADCVVIVTHHKAFSPKLIAESAKVVVDTRNLLKGLTGPAAIKRL